MKGCGSSERWSSAALQARPVNIVFHSGDCAVYTAHQDLRYTVARLEVRTAFRLSLPLLPSSREGISTSSLDANACSALYMML